MSKVLFLILTMIGTSFAADQQAYTSRSDGSRLGLSILGAIVGRQDVSQNNVVLIKEQESGRVRAVKRDFVLLGKYLVSEIHPKYIVLTHNEERHLVYQNKFASEFMERAAPVANVNNLSFAEEGFERRDNAIQMTAMYRDRMLQQDLPSILMQATAVPHVVDGEVKGFRLFQIDQGSIYDKAGFQNHDIVTHINGQPLNNAGTAIQLMQSLRTAAHIVVDLERGGQSVQIDLRID